MKLVFLALLSITQLWSSPRPPPKPISTRVNTTWSPPPPGWVKLNYAATPSSTGVAACVARTSEGVFKGGWAARCGPFSSGPDCAARLASLAASSYGFFSRVVLEGDEDWDAHVFVHDFVGGLQSYSWVNVDRSSNEAAHVLADWAFSNDFEGFLVGDALTFLVKGLDQL